MPPNWTKKPDGTFYNVLTKKTVKTPPRWLPEGWVEKLSPDSGRVYYYHAATRKTSYAYPGPEDVIEPEPERHTSGRDSGRSESGRASSAKADDDDDGFLSKSVSFFTGKKPKKAAPKKEALAPVVESKPSEAKKPEAKNQIRVLEDSPAPEI